MLAGAGAAGEARSAEGVRVRPGEGLHCSVQQLAERNNLLERERQHAKELDVQLKGVLKTGEDALRQEQQLASSLRDRLHSLQVPRRARLLCLLWTRWLIISAQWGLALNLRQDGRGMSTAIHSCPATSVGQFACFSCSRSCSSGSSSWSGR